MTSTSPHISLPLSCRQSRRFAAVNKSVKESKESNINSQTKTKRFCHYFLQDMASTISPAYIPNPPPPSEHSCFSLALLNLYDLKSPSSLLLQNISGERRRQKLHFHQKQEGGGDSLSMHSVSWKGIGTKSSKSKSCTKKSHGKIRVERALSTHIMSRLFKFSMKATQEYCAKLLRKREEER